MCKKVSVIMGVYNCANVLSEAIDSIIAQTYTNWELIICDDCSLDDTYNIAHSYQIKYPDKIVLIQNDKNRKLAYSLNRCLEHTTGEYVARMDADDTALPDRFRIQVAYLDLHPDVAVVGSYANIFDGEHIVGIRKVKTNPTKEDMIHTVPFMHPTIMMRREVYEALGGYTVARRTQRGQDKDLWFRFFAAGYIGVNLEIPLLNYHESTNDYKKRTLKTSFFGMVNAFIGFHILHVPIWKYVYAVFPLISYFVPQKIKKMLRNEISK